MTVYPNSGGWWGITPPYSPPRLVRRVVIEEYEMHTDTWGSAPVHRCPLTEAKPGEVMMYYCPECAGTWC